MFLPNIRKVHPNHSKASLDDAMKHSMHTSKLALTQVNVLTGLHADILIWVTNEQKLHPVA